MKRDARKWWLKAWLIAIIPLAVACTSDDDYDYDMANYFNEVTSYGSYEGEWTVNRQVVDTARLVVANNVMQLRLPEEYLLSTYILSFLNKTADGAAYESTNMADEIGHESTTTETSYVLSNFPSEMQVAPQGYSEKSQYMSFSSTTIQSSGARRWYITCSFMASINRTLYQISLLSKENAMAIVQNTTGQWTLGIPIDGFLLTNLVLSTTDSSTLQELPNTVTIYYNTKRRIE